MDAMTQVGDGVHLVQGTDVGWVLVEDGDALTVVDTGYPGDAERLDASVRALGREPGDVAAVLVTHWHVDHVGNVVRWSGRHGVPVLVHPDERANATGERHESATPLDVAARLAAAHRAVGHPHHAGRCHGPPHAARRRHVGRRRTARPAGRAGARAHPGPHERPRRLPVPRGRVVATAASTTRSTPPSPADPHAR